MVVKIDKTKGFIVIPVQSSGHTTRRFLVSDSYFLSDFMVSIVILTHCSDSDFLSDLIGCCTHEFFDIRKKIVIGTKNWTGGVNRPKGKHYCSEHSMGQVNITGLMRLIRNDSANIG